MRSNCLLFAARRWWQRGGYVIIRHSDYGWWPHFLWSADLKTFEQFHPNCEKKQGRCPPVFFHGHIKRGMDDPRPLGKSNHERTTESES